MIFRATLALLATLFAGLSFPSAASAATYLREQNFASSPKNWRQLYPRAQFYGYEAATRRFAGSAGGLFLPQTYFNYYADLFLNGTLSRGTPLNASGQLALDRISTEPPYANSVYVGHFNRGSNGFINSVGFALTGNDGTNVICTAVIEFSDGTAFIGRSFSLPVGKDNPPLNWSYTWDPTGGTQGFGALTVDVGGPAGGTSTVDLTKTSAGLDFFVDSFGFYQPPFVAPNSNTFAQLSITQLLYTALPGRAPTLSIKGRRNLSTTSAQIVLNGLARTTEGNRIEAVRYRVVTGDRIGRYRRADGTTKWTARVRVPEGRSRVQVVAVTDSGLKKSATRRVVRTAN